MDHTQQPARPSGSHSSKDVAAGTAPHPWPAAHAPEADVGACGHAEELAQRDAAAMQLGSAVAVGFIPLHCLAIMPLRYHRQCSLQVMACPHGGSMCTSDVQAAADAPCAAAPKCACAALAPQVLQAKVKKLEQLVRLKDARIQALLARMGDSGDDMHAHTAGSWHVSSWEQPLTIM